MQKFDDIYREHSKMVFNLALQYVQNYEEAQEIAQDVFVSVNQSMRTFNGQSSIKTWVYRITINKSLDHIKAKKRKKRFGIFTSLFYDESNEVKHDQPEFDHPGVQMEHKESISKIFKLINELPENQKTALILSKIEQKSQAEIAEIMGTSNKAVESLIQRAKTNLSKKLEGSEGK